jgi:hypothetical protein
MLGGADAHMERLTGVGALKGRGGERSRNGPALPLELCPMTSERMAESAGNVQC